MRHIPAGLKTRKTIKLTKSFWKDFAWWEEALKHFVDKQQGVSFWMADTEDLRFDRSVGTDASGYGLGVKSGENSFHFLWNPKQRKNSINWKELKTVLVAAEKWHDQWFRKDIVVYSDNSTTVNLINNGSTKHPQLMKLVRRLHLLALKGNFNVKARHIPGVQNVVPDYLSRMTEGEILQD